MATTAGRVLVDVSFNPDTKQLEKVVQDAEGKVITQKLELDTGNLEGPLKDFQEFTAKLAEGGAEKGLGQITKAFSTFKNVAGSGGDIFTASAAGMAEIGAEAGAVVQGVAAVGTATVAAFTIAATAIAVAGAAFGEWLSGLQENQRLLAGAGQGFSEYSQNVRGAADMTQFLALKNAALSTGLMATGKDLAAVTNSLKTYAEATGDSSAAQQLYTQALSGNIEAARRLGVVVDEYATSQQVAAAAIAQFNAESANNQTLGSTLSDIWSGFKADLGELGQALKDVIGTFLLFNPISLILIGTGVVLAKLVKVVADGIRSVKEFVASFDFTGVGAALERVRTQEQRLEDARRQAADNRRREAQNQVADANSAFRIAQAEYNQLLGLGDAEDTIVEARRRRVELTNRLADDEEALRRAQANPLTTDAERTALMNNRLRTQQQLNEATRTENEFDSRTAGTQRAIAELARQRALYEAGISREKPNQNALSERLANNERSMVSAQQELVGATGRRRQELLKTIDDLLRERGIIRGTMELEEDRRKREQQEAAAARARAAQEAAARRQREEQEFNDMMAKERQIRELAQAAQEQRWQNFSSMVELARTLRSETLEAASALATAEAGRFDRSFAAYQRDNALLEQARQRSAEGLQLTRAQAEALANQANEQERNAAAARENQDALDAIDTRLQQLFLTDAERLNLEQRKNELRQRGNEIELEGIRIRERANRTDVERDNDFIERSNRLIQRAPRITQALVGAAGGFKSFGAAATDLGVNVLGKLENAFGSVIQTWVEGKEDVGKFAQEALKTMLATLAQEASVNALKYAAQGLGLLSNPATAPLAPTAFAAAAAWGAVAAAAGGVSAAIPAVEKEKTGKGAEGGSVGGGQSASSMEEQPDNRPVIININTRQFSTAEEIEDAIYSGVRSAQRRRGER